MAIRKIDTDFYVIKVTSGRYEGMYVDSCGYDYNEHLIEYSHISEINYAKPYTKNSIRRALRQYRKTTGQECTKVLINIEYNYWEYIC